MLVACSAPAASGFGGGAGAGVACTTGRGAAALPSYSICFLLGKKQPIDLRESSALVPNGALQCTQGGRGVGKPAINAYRSYSRLRPDDVSATNTPGTRQLDRNQPRLVSTLCCTARLMRKAGKPPRTSSRGPQDIGLNRLAREHSGKRRVVPALHTPLHVSKTKIYSLRCT